MCAPHLSEIAQDIEARASYNIYQILPSGHLVHYLYPLYVHVCQLFHFSSRIFFSSRCQFVFWFERLHVLMSGFSLYFLPYHAAMDTTNLRIQ